MRESFDLIILTKSAKYGGYCVAGIEPKSRKWRRLVTGDENSHGALSDRDLIDTTGRTINVLDCIKVIGAEHQPGSIQTENYLIDKFSALRYIHTTNISEISNYCNEDSSIFLGERHVMRGDISSLKHSLELRCVHDLKIYTVKSGTKVKTKADFLFSGKRHEQYSVTDRQYFLPEGDLLHIDKAYIAFSIADDEWSHKNGHYKYIAAIYDLKPAEDMVPIHSEEDDEILSEYWIEGNESDTDFLCDDLPEFDHPTFGHGRILSIDGDSVIAQAGSVIKEIPSSLLQKEQILSLEMEEILSIHSGLAIDKKANPTHVVERVHDAVKDYLSVLECENKGRSIIPGVIMSRTVNVLKIHSGRKIPYPDAVEFLVNGEEYSQRMLSVEDYDADSLTLTVRALGKCAQQNWKIGDRIDIVSDLKFLLKNLDKWYDRYKKYIAYPPVPTMRSGIQYMYRIPSEEQQRAIVRSLNAPIAYVWGAPGTGKTGYVLANCVRYCLQTGRKVGLFAPTNHALDMALINIIDELKACGIPYDTSILRLGIATRQLQDKYPEVCEHQDQAAQAKKYGILCDQIKKIIKWRKTLRNAAIIETVYPDFESAIKTIKTIQSLDAKTKEYDIVIGLLGSEIATLKRKIANNTQAIACMKEKLKPGIGLLFRLISGEKAKIEQRILELESSNKDFDRELALNIEALEKNESEKAQTVLFREKNFRYLTEECISRIKAISTLSSYMKSFISKLTYMNYSDKYGELKKEVEDTKKDVLNKLADYSEYEHLSDEQLMEQYHTYVHRASAVAQNKKSICLLASTLDVYNARIGVAEPGETDHRQFCMSFDQIFLDEAGYCSLPKALPLFAQHCPVVLLGDHMQLSPISEMSSANESMNPNLLLWKESAITASNLLSGQSAMGQTTLNDNMVCSNLTLSHRFSDNLAGILNRYVYQNGFRGIKERQFLVQCIDTGKPLPEDLKNSCTPEADAIVKLTHSLQEDFVVLTPYRNQETLIRKKQWKLAEEEKLMTIHRSQGREWDTVILSLVDQFPGFFTNSSTVHGIHTINTAISRTKRKLILVGNIDNWSGYTDQMISELIAQKISNAELEQSPVLPEALPQPTKANASQGTIVSKPTNRKNFWSKQEDDYLRNAYLSNASIKEICTQLERTESKVKSRLVYLDVADRSILGKNRYPDNGYAHSGLPWYPDEEEKLVALFHSGLTPPEISDGMQRSLNSIAIRLEELGLIENRIEYLSPYIS